MISIRLLLFIVFVVATALAASMATLVAVRYAWVFTSLYLLFFTGFASASGINAIYGQEQSRRFWTGCSLVLASVFLTDWLFHPAAYETYREVTGDWIVQILKPKNVDLGFTRNDIAASHARDILEFCCFILVSICGGIYANSRFVKPRSGKSSNETKNT